MTDAVERHERVIGRLRVAVDAGVLTLVAHRQLAHTRRYVIDHCTVAVAAALRRARALGRVTVVTRPQAEAAAFLCDVSRKQDH